MTMLFVTDGERRALMADRERATRSLDDLIARERADLAPRLVGVRRRGASWRWTRRILASMPLRVPPPHPPRRLTEECA